MGGNSGKKLSKELRFQLSNVSSIRRKISDQGRFFKSIFRLTRIDKVATYFHLFPPDSIKSKSNCCNMLFIKIFLTLTSLAILSSPAFAVNPFKKQKTKTTVQESSLAASEYKGIKHAVGVTDFENIKYNRYYSDLSNNLASMLEASLFETGRFVIVERKEIADVFTEQDLQASGRAATAKSVAQTGLIRSAKYIATGSVTRVDTNTSGNDGGIGIRGIRIGGSSSKAEIELVVKLVDTTSGEVVASKRIVGVAGGSKIRVGFYKNGVSGNLGSFAKTPIGEAAQDCISAATDFIASEMEDYDITANIVMVKSDDMIVINRGESYGVTAGNVFEVREAGEILTDPDTGEILDVFEGAVTGTIEVTRITEKVSYCKLIDGITPNRGDSVVYKD